MKLFIAWALCFTFSLNACSRFTYTAADGTVVVGRSMDWLEDIHTNLFAFPAGMDKTGGDLENSVKWTSKYGSVIASGYDLGSTDGINSEGFVANLLYLATADFGKASPDQQNLDVLQWAQYFLDNYSTVEEAVSEFSKANLHIATKPLPGGIYPGVHLSISDPTGNNAIFEYVEGKLVVYQGKEYTVMTNEPTYEKQLTLNNYWQGLKGCFLPGTAEPTDRFVRASYYLKHAPAAKSVEESVAIVFSIIRNVSEPISKLESDRPNQSPTIWCTVADAKNKVYYFQDTHKPNIFWVDLSKVDLKLGAPVKKLTLAGGEIYAGEASSHFISIGDNSAL